MAQRYPGSGNSDFWQTAAARGEPMNLAQALPPPVPLEQNNAGQFLKAVALMENENTCLKTNPVFGERMVARGKAIVCATRADVREPGEYGYTNSWKEEQGAVASNTECLDLLRSMVAKPKLIFPIPYTNGFTSEGFFTNTHLVELKKSAQLLAGAAIVELHRHNIEAAITNTRAALAISEAMQDERMAISELVRIAIANIAQGATWEILQTRNQPIATWLHCKTIGRAKIFPIATPMR